MKNIFDSIKQSVCISTVCTLLGCCILFGCQPKADYKEVLLPMKNFTNEINDSVRGAKTMEDLSCYLYLALKGDITFEKFSKFIPDSNDVAGIYSETQTPADARAIKENADSAFSKLRKSFFETKSKSAIFHTSWSDATFEKVMIFNIEDQKIPSTRIIMETKTGKDYLRCSVMCLQINGRWFIGENLKYGV
ncbi:MAG: hypothetical protein LH473_12495 [Chitinophagales bacterium]|nr:hypothetical protein [Chitinophagales bacterium]